MSFIYSGYNIASRDAKTAKEMINNGSILPPYLVENPNVLYYIKLDVF